MYPWKIIFPRLKIIFSRSENYFLVIQKIILGIIIFIEGAPFSSLCHHCIFNSLQIADCDKYTVCKVSYVILVS